MRWSCREQEMVCGGWVWKTELGSLVEGLVHEWKDCELGG